MNAEQRQAAQDLAQVETPPAFTTLRSIREAATRKALGLALDDLDAADDLAARQATEIHRLDAEVAKLRRWCAWMIGGIQHAIELTHTECDDRGDCSVPQDQAKDQLHKHLLGTLTDEETGEAIPELLGDPT